MLNSLTHTCHKACHLLFLVFAAVWRQHDLSAEVSQPLKFFSALPFHPVYDRISCSLGWPRTHYVAQAYLNLSSSCLRFPGY